MAGLHAPRSWWGRVLPLAIQETRAGLAAEPAPKPLAAARLAVLEEMDPQGTEARFRLGPYFGFIGRYGGEEKEPRLRETDVGHGARSISRTVALSVDTLAFLAFHTGLELS